MKVWPATALGVGAGWADVAAIHYLPSASGADRQGFVRMINHSPTGGEVSIVATDDSGLAFEAVMLPIDAEELDIEALAYIRTNDGLTSMLHVLPRSGLTSARERIDRQARTTVTRELGHNRREVSSATSASEGGRGPEVDGIAPVQEVRTSAKVRNRSV